MPVILFAYINKLIDLKFNVSENDDQLFSSIGTHSFGYKVEVNGTVTETKGFGFHKVNSCVQNTQTCCYFTKKVKADNYKIL